MLDDSHAESTTHAEPIAAAKEARTGRNAVGSSKTRRLYGYGAERRSQPKTTDLIPKRWFTYSAIVVLLVATIAVLNGMAIYSVSLHSYLGDEGVAAFSLQGSGTLASWFTTVLLAFAAAFCLQVYYLRKHRCDDYRGSYRLWLWAFSVFLAGSVSDTLGLGQVIRNVVATAAGTLPMIGTVSVLAVVACVALTAMVMVATWETRVSRGTIALIAFSWLAGLVSILSVEPAVNNQLTEANLISVASNAWIVFSSCAFLAVLTYARYVYLAANGMLAVRQVESKPVKDGLNKKPVRATAKQAPQKSSAATAKPKPVAAKPVASKAKPVAAKGGAAKPGTTPNRLEELRKQAIARKAAAQPTEILGQTLPVAPSQDEEPTLSKADRRRQKKLERREKRAA